MPHRLYGAPPSVHVPSFGELHVLFRMPLLGRCVSPFTCSFVTSVIVVAVLEGSQLETRLFLKGLHSLRSRHEKLTIRRSIIVWDLYIRLD